MDENTYFIVHRASYSALGHTDDLREAKRLCLGHTGQRETLVAEDYKPVTFVGKRVEKATGCYYRVVYTPTFKAPQDDHQINDIYRRYADDISRVKLAPMLQLWVALKQAERYMVDIAPFAIGAEDVLISLEEARGRIEES